MSRPDSLSRDWARWRNAAGVPSESASGKPNRRSRESESAASQWPGAGRLGLISRSFGMPAARVWEPKTQRKFGGEYGKRTRMFMPRVL